MASYMLVPLNKVFLFTNCDELHSHTRLPLLVFLLMSAPSSASDFCWVRPAKGWWKNNPPTLIVGGWRGPELVWEVLLQQPWRSSPSETAKYRLH